MVRTCFVAVLSAGHFHFAIVTYFLARFALFAIVGGIIIGRASRTSNVGRVRVFPGGAQLAFVILFVAPLALGARFALRCAIVGILAVCTREANPALDRVVLVRVAGLALIRVFVRLCPWLTALAEITLR